MSRTIIRRDRSSPPRWTGRGLALLLLGAAVLLGLVRSILDTYFTSRVVELPPPPAATWSPLAKRVALVVLDGLRPMEAFDPEYMRAFSERRRQSAWGIARSGEITMTVPGVRMLGAGVSSDFMEILHNWNPRSSPVTSLFTVAKMKGLHTVLYGDHVWKRAFTKDIDSHVDTHLDPWSYYSGPVHAPDLSLLEDLRTLWTSRAPFDLLVIHFVGPDHASHRNRVTSPEFQAFTRWMDPKLDELLDGLLASGATILVTSDHGMSDWGQHGGDEPTARKTPYLLQGPGIKVGPGSTRPIFRPRSRLCWGCPCRPSERDAWRTKCSPRPRTPCSPSCAPTSPRPTLTCAAINGSTAAYRGRSSTGRPISRVSPPSRAPTAPLPELISISKDTTNSVAWWASPSGALGPGSSLSSCSLSSSCCPTYGPRCRDDLWRRPVWRSYCRLPPG